MLRANVGLSRKLSKDYNSSGFSINLEGEITAPLQDGEAVIEQVKQLFDTAEEALTLQVSRVQSDAPNGVHRTPPLRATNGKQESLEADQHRARTYGEEDRATEKQINYLLSIGKRQRFNTLQLERKIGELLEAEIGLYDLSKRQAAQAIDMLSSNGASERRFA